MNILVTGSRGQLGSELKELEARHIGHTWYFRDLPELDITSSAHVESFCRDRAIGVIVNCAAYTAVDRAETDVETAFRVNRHGATVLATAAKSCDALLIHISTDYVFDGSNCRPYREDDLASPLGVYGQSKWEGEEEIRKTAPSHMIIRTSWLYSIHGQNFIKTMLRLGSERESVGVVFDQAGSPTWAADLAAAIVTIIDRHNIGQIYAETYHYSNEGVCSWYDVARAVMDAKGLPCRVHPIESADYPTPSKRPHYSVLNKKKIREAWNLEIPHWQDSLDKMLARCQ